MPHTLTPFERYMLCRLEDAITETVNRLPGTDEDARPEFRRELQKLALLSEELTKMLPLE